MLVVVEGRAGTCQDCDGALSVEKTWVRGGVTMAHGRARIHQTVRRCMRCHRRYGAEDLASTFPSRSTVGYDVIVRVGLERFVHHRQRAEIRVALAAEGAEVSEAEISVLGQRFVGYLEALHQARAAELRAALRADGGWPMHIDATGEDGRGTLFVVYAGWRCWALGAWKLPTERADAMLPRLLEVAVRFGDPCAIMRDLGRAVTEAAATFVAQRKLKIPVLACHLHFLRDIGKDLMRESHDQMSASMRRFKVRARLGALARKLGRSLDTELAEARRELLEWQRRSGHDHRLPNGRAGLAVVRALAQWTLDFASDGFDQGFPFDVPMLALYDRSREAARAIDAFLRKPPRDLEVRGTCEQLREILRPVESEVPFELWASRLRARRALFQQLREALRLDAKPTGPTSHSPGRARQDDAEPIDQIRLAVEKLEASLGLARPARGPAKYARDGIDIVLTHLKRHGPALWGHHLVLHDGGTRLVARTNNALETFFRDIKHGERRRSGRKVLTQDLEHMPPAAVLATNLSHQDYVQILCGSLDALPQAFAQLDALGHGPASLADARAADADVMTASLPTADKLLVRNAEMFGRVAAAADSRAPRR